MASKIKKQIQDEILNVATLLDDGSMKKSLLEGLYNQIAKYDDDKDIVNTVWANKDLPLRMFTNDELGMMPGLSNIIIGERYDKKIDYDKAFGKDWYKNTSEIPYNQIALVAAKQGRDPKQVIQEMTDEAIQKNRYDAAHEGVARHAEPVEILVYPALIPAILHQEIIGTYAEELGDGVDRRMRRIDPTPKPKLRQIRRREDVTA